MFTYLRNFVRRHQRKFVAISILGGGAYILSRYANYWLRKYQEQIARDLMEKAKKQYYFNTTQTTCGESVRSFLPLMQATGKEKFNDDVILEDIKNRKASLSETLQLWDQLKVMSVCKVLGFVYGSAFVILVSRIQFNVLGAYSYLKASHENSSVELTNDERLAYLSIMHDVVLKGFLEFLKRLEGLACDVIEPISLKERVSFEKLTSVLYELKNNIDLIIQANHLNYLFPIDTGDQHGSLEHLLSEVREVIENRDTLITLQQLTQVGLSNVLDSLAMEWEKSPNGSKGHPRELLFHQITIPFAKVLPLFTPCCDVSSLVTVMEKSEALQTFSANIYEAFLQPASHHI